MSLSNFFHSVETVQESFSIYFCVMGHFRKHPYHPYRGNWKLTPLPPSDVLIHLLLSETIFSPLPPDGRKWGECGSFLERPIPCNCMIVFKLHSLHEFLLGVSPYPPPPLEWILGGHRCALLPKGMQGGGGQFP